MALTTYYGSFGFPDKKKGNGGNNNNGSREHSVRVENDERGTGVGEGLFVFGLEKTSVYFSFYVMSYCSFSTSGASMFSFSEMPAETSLRLKVESTKQNFSRAYPGVPDQASEDSIAEVVAASNRGVSATRNATGESNWSFGQSFFFTSTVVTTIGYGHVTPLSRAGKIFCIVYAVVGIPSTSVSSSASVARLSVPTSWSQQWLNSRSCHVYEPFSIRSIHLAIVMTFFSVTFSSIPAGIFAEIEPEWDYMDSSYYCFISLTTVGSGDYIPGDSPNQPYRPLYKIATTGFLYVGVTFSMVTSAVFYDIPQSNSGGSFTTSDPDSEKKPSAAGSGMSMRYGGAADSNVLPDPNEGGSHRQVVRVRSRRADSPSPDEPAQNKNLISP